MVWSGCFARGRICEVGFVKAAVSRRRLACSGLFAKEPGDSFVVRRDRAWQVHGPARSSVEPAST